MAVSIAIAVGLVNMLDSGHFLSHLDVPLEKKKIRAFSFSLQVPYLKDFQGMFPKV